MALRFLMMLLVVSLVGCASTQSQNMNAQMQMRIGELEKQVTMKDEEVKSLQEEVRELSYNVDRLNGQVRRDSGSRSSTSSSKSSGKTDDILRVSVSPETVQKALQGAGVYDGAIDGKLGARTRDAISRFQKDHGLKADGVIGQQAWTELKTYLK